MAGRSERKRKDGNGVDNSWGQHGKVEASFIKFTIKTLRYVLCLHSQDYKYRVYSEGSIRLSACHLEWSRQRYLG